MNKILYEASYIGNPKSFFMHAKNRILSIGIIGMMLFGVWETGKGQQSMPNYAENADVAEVTETAEPKLIGKIIGMGIEISDIEAQCEKVLGEIVEETPYYVTCRWVDCAPEQIPPPSERTGEWYNYAMPLVQIEIPFNGTREERINRMLIEEGRKRLPGGIRKEWKENVAVHIDYRSDRYLCWHYIPRPSLPGECERENLYFTLDLDQEKLVEYPEGGMYWDWDGELYKEMEKSWEKTVEEQDAAQREKGYALHEIQVECDGTVFPAVEVTGLADRTVQKRINRHLQEGLRACIENEGWEKDKDGRQELFDGTRIYVSYKSDIWLSVVYSIPTAEQWRWEDDEICDLPVVVNIKTGERVMLDDLVEMEGLINCMAFNKAWQVKSDEISELNGLLRTEKDNLQNMTDKGRLAVSSYHSEWRTFYLYKGKLVLLYPVSIYDYEVPLPEIYNYLKVDPWYD